LPLAGLVLVNLAILASTRDVRSTLVAALITSTLACVLVLGATELVTILSQPFDPID
jgi:hypothetical protein